MRQVQDEGGHVQHHVERDERDVQVAAARVGPDTVRSPTMAVRDPADRDRVVGVVACSPPDLVDRAVRVADEAGRDWASWTPSARRKALEAAATAALDGIRERAELLTREEGKVLWESIADVAAAPYLLGVAADLVDRVAEEERIERRRGDFVRRRRPAGVVAVIVPWNSPVVLAFNGIAPALAAGNTVVVKPSELAPLALTKTLTLLAEGLPPGVVNICPGTGPETGAALAAHPLVRRVLLTGGTRAGQAAMRAAAGPLAGVSLELGGNDPAIVLESAHIGDDLVEQLRHAVYTGTGQVCFAVKRIYVARRHHDELVARFMEATDEIVVGNGLDERSTIGPLISDEARDRVRRLIERAADAGGTVTELGRALDPASWDAGSFLLPHVVTGLPHASELVAVEQFGPVVPFVPFDREEEAIAMANDSQYGLSASLWSEDVDHAMDLGREIDAGTVWVNVHRAGASDHTTPYGGTKCSGIGRSNGWASVEELTETQMLIHRRDVERLPGPALLDQLPS